MKIRSLSTILLIASSLIINAEDGVTADSILIGQSAALEGPAAKLGLGMKAGMEAAFTEANNAGGINGRTLELISLDDSYEPDSAISATLELIEDEGVFCLAGYVGTPTAKAVLPIIEDTEVPLVGLFTGAGFLRQPVKETVFNVRSSYDEETDALVERLTKDLGLTKIAVFHQDDSFGQVGLSGTTKALEKRGLSVVGTGTYQRNTTAVKGGLAELLEVSPEAIIMVGAYRPLAEFVKEAKAAGLDAVFATISFTGTEATIAELGDKSEGLVISQVVPSPNDTSIPVVADYQKALKAIDEEVTYTSLEGYITAKTLLAGLENAGAELTRGGLISGLHALDSHDLGGVKVSFSPDNHQALSEVYITQVRGQKAVQVEKITAP